MNIRTPLLAKAMRAYDATHKDPFRSQASVVVLALRCFIMNHGEGIDEPEPEDESTAVDMPGWIGYGRLWPWRLKDPLIFSQRGRDCKLLKSWAKCNHH